MGADHKAPGGAAERLGEGNRGMPDGEMLRAWEGYSILRTDRNGWIEIETDGEQMWVEAAR